MSAGTEGEGVAIWTTRDERRIPVTDMEDRHLTNTLAFVERQSFMPYFGDGEMAEMYHDAAEGQFEAWQSEWVAILTAEVALSAQDGPR